MKILMICLASLVLLISCKKEAPIHKTEQQDEKETSKDKEQKIKDTIVYDTIIPLSEKDLVQKKNIVIKRERLLTTKDDKQQLQELVVSKSFLKKEDLYVLDYKYPYLNEKIDPLYAVFNDFIKETYLDIEKTANQILEDKELLCDTLKISRFRDKRIIDYKVYSAKNNLMSVVLYKENYYSGMRYSTYLFDCINFDLKKHRFIYFDDFFEPNSDKQVFTAINTVIKKGITSGELYYDCWELSEGDFNAYKNNFVVDDDMIKFYFDDCIVCPSYTGTYSIQIPIKDIMHLIKKYNNTPGVS
ncbi:RsiV family protein [Aquimarina aquimarini]|uniref:RsiV family protein n=1 Tax=Aquimarina aquimarini TaxID=1191734 RepID=UPI001F41D147|nr:RsiV family protein [Aquimarina aquimarini]